MILFSLVRHPDLTQKASARKKVCLWCLIVAAASHSATVPLISCSRSLHTWSGHEKGTRSRRMVAYRTANPNPFPFFEAGQEEEGREGLCSTGSWDDPSPTGRGHVVERKRWQVACSKRILSNRARLSRRKGQKGRDEDE